MKRRNLLSSLSVLTALSLFGAGSAYAADIYPSKPLLTIVPFSAGGGNDILLRIMGKYAEKHLGQTLTVDAKPGAGGRSGGALRSSAKAAG